MINLQVFDMSLKITWIRKMETGQPDWLDFPLTYKIDSLKQMKSTISICLIRLKILSGV